MQQIGHGQSGTVYLQGDHATVSKVCNNPSQFKRELKWLRIAQDVPNTIKLIGFDVSTSSLTLEYVPYKLEDLLVNKQLKSHQKQQILRQLREFLAYPKSWVHNDFKAKNILVTNLENPEIKIIDFDLAKSSKNKEIDLKKFRVLQRQLEHDMSYEQALKSLREKCSESGKGI